MNGGSRVTVVRRRLLLAKALLDRGIRSSDTPDPIGRLLALEALHMSVEATLRAIALHFELEAEEEKDLGFVQWARAIQKELKGRTPKLELPDFPGIQRLNTKRNLAVHHAEPVAASTLAESRLTAEEFFSRSLERFFQLQAAELEELTFLADPSLREMIVLARRIAESGSRTSAQVGCGYLWLAFESGRASSGIIESDAALMASGINPQDLRTFREFVPAVEVAWGRTQMGLTRDDVTPELYQWSERFVVDSLLQWQYRGLNPAFLQDPSLLDEMRERAK